MYREWDLNPHNHFWSRDFKSLVSTDSTIAALRNNHSINPATIIHSKPAAKVQIKNEICKSQLQFAIRLPYAIRDGYPKRLPDNDAGQP